MNMFYTISRSVRKNVCYVLSNLEHKLAHGNTLTCRRGSPYLCFSKTIASCQTLPRSVSAKHLRNLNETAFARNVLESYPQYDALLVKMEQLEKEEQDISETTGDILESVAWSDMSTDEVVSMFENISKRATVPISDPTCEQLRDSLKNHIGLMRDEQLAAILMNLSLWPLSESAFEIHFAEVWNEIDKTCLSRWKKWEVDKIFLFMNLWHHLRLARQSDFVYKAAGKFTVQPKK